MNFWKVIYENVQKNPFISQQTLHILQRFVLSLKNSHFAYIPPYMPKSLPTLENEKGQ